MKISIKTRFIIHHIDKVGLLKIIIGELAKLEIKNISNEDSKINFEFKKTTYGEMVYKIAIPDEGNFMIEYATTGTDSLVVLYTASIIITTELLILIGLLLLGVLFGSFYLFVSFIFSLQQIYRFIIFRKGIMKMKENILNSSQEWINILRRLIFNSPALALICNQCLYK